MKTVADQFVEPLAAAGVKRIYGIVGDSLNDTIFRTAPLLPLAYYDQKSKTPAAKSIPVLVRPQ